MNVLEKLIGYLMISVTIVSCLDYDSKIGIKKAYDGNVSYRKALRSYDGFGVCTDIAREGEYYEDEVECQSLQDEFQTDGNYYSLEELEHIKEEILEMCHRYDANSNFFIPDSFDPFDENCLVTTYDRLRSIIEEYGDFSDAESQIVSEFENCLLPNEDEVFDEYFKNDNLNVKTLNIFVPGIGADASCWTNDGNECVDEDHLFVRKGTLPYEVARLYSSDIYVGRTNYGNEGSYNEFALTVGYDTQCKLQYNDISNFTFFDGAVILYENSEKSTSFTNEYYEDFVLFMDEILAMYPNAKFNLFGHSRGGDINLMYATEFEDRVINIFSMGTPYYTVELAKLSTITDKIIEIGHLEAIKEFLTRAQLEHLDAYESLSNKTEMAEMRYKWDKSNHNTNLYAIGYGTSVEISFFLNILGYMLRVDISIGIPWDVLVGTNNAQGLPDEYVSFEIFGIRFEIYQPTDNDLKIMHAKDRMSIFIGTGYIADCVANKKYRISYPKSPAVPHNLETMHPGTINTIMGWLQ